MSPTLRLCVSAVVMAALACAWPAAAQTVAEPKAKQEEGVQAPLMRMSKADIAREGARLGVDFAQTVSCYQADADGRACGRCDACRLRADGFAAAGVPDPTRYRENQPLGIRGPLAQSVEHRTFNPLVDGSNPSRPTNRLPFHSGPQ